LGLRQVIRHFNRNELGAIVLDEDFTKPSTAEHFFGLLGKT
jgi:lauroyl/myristoyl acyltransferase